MKKKYFGTDGIRGEVGTFPIIESFFFKSKHLTFITILLNLFEKKVSLSKQGRP